MELSEFREKSFVQRLAADIPMSFRDLEPFRAARTTRWGKYAGHNYSPSAWPDPTQRNIIARQVNVLGRYLSVDNPQCMYTTKRRDLWPEAYNFAAVTNEVAKRMNVADAYNETVRDALIAGVATIKVGFDGNQCYAYAVDMDNLLMDTQARRRSEMTYIGDRYMLPLETAKTPGVFDPEAIGKINHSHRRSDYTGGMKNQNMVGMGASQAQRQPIVPFVYCVDVYFPMFKVLMTLEGDPNGGYQVTDNVLRVEKFTGPDHGPYRQISFLEVCGNLMPVAVTALIEDQHDAINEVANREANRARAYRENTYAPLTSKDDADRITDSEDMQHVHTGSATQISKISIGGATAQGTLFVQNNTSAALEEAGSIRVLDGSAPQADTATQETILSRSASKFVDSLRTSAVRYLAGIFQDISYYSFHTPERHAVVRKIGSSEEVFFFGPYQSHMGEFSDYEMEPVIYDERVTSPDERIQTIDYLLRSVFIPGEPRMNQAGFAIDWVAVKNIYRDNKRLPELDLILRPINAVGQARDQADPAAGPQTSERTYIRKNMGTGRQKQEENMNQQAALSMMQDGQE